MDHERDGFVDDPRPGQQRETQEDARGIQKKDDDGISPEGSVEIIENDNKEGEEERLEAALQEIAAISTEWIGPLPTPGSLGQYKDDVQDKIVEWADRKVKALYDDESERQDRLVDAEIRQGMVGQIASAAIMIIALVLAAVVGMVTGNAVMSGAFLVLPFATIIGNLFKPVRSGKKKSEKDNK